MIDQNNPLTTDDIKEIVGVRLDDDDFTVPQGDSEGDEHTEEGTGSSDDEEAPESMYDDYISILERSVDQNPKH